MTNLITIRMRRLVPLVLMPVLIAATACQPGLPADATITIIDSEPIAAAYCEEQGGRVISRTPTYGTNLATSDQLALREPMQFCNFESEPDGTSFQSQIEIDLTSLYSENPTLALLAYLEAPPPDMEGYAPSVNPSIVHCSQLGGSATFGMATDANGGGWVKAADDTSDIFDVLTPCVFPDGSAIDSWGITYHAEGTVRGTDLQTVVRYQPDGDYPAIFGRSP